MPIYIYSATDNAGVRKEGTVDARTQETAVNLLRAQGLFVVSLQEKKSAFLDILVGMRGIPQAELSAFTRQFATMMSSGLPVSRSLEVLSQQTNNKNFKKILLDVLRDVEGGSALSEGMSRYPQVFSRTYRALVKAGESSGKLDTILERLAVTLENERELNGKFKAAMVYPTVVFMAMIGVFFILMIFVIPKLADMYKSLDVDLPASTQFLINFSEFIIRNIFVVIGLMVFAVWGLRTVFSSEAGKKVASDISFKLPIFGKINRMKENAQFTRTMGLLISSAVPIVEALEIVSEVMTNDAYKRASLEAAEQVRRGRPLSEYMQTNKVFPAFIGDMARVGEETGQMDQLFEKASYYFDGEVDHLVKGLTGALEPVILVMLGGMVGTLIVAIITPIYKITSAL